MTSVSGTACRAMRRFPSDTIVHAKGARLLHWLVVTIADRLPPPDQNHDWQLPDEEDGLCH